MVRVVWALLALFALSACTAEAPQGPLTTSSQFLDVVRQGALRLTCATPACAQRWSSRQAEAANYANQSRWAELSALVGAANYPSDLSYFYLGRAADGLNSPRGAEQYFSLARSELQGPRSCVQSGLCRDRNMAADIERESAAARRRVAALSRPVQRATPTTPVSADQPADYEQIK